MEARGNQVIVTIQSEDMNQRQIGQNKVAQSRTFVNSTRVLTWVAKMFPKQRSISSTSTVARERGCHPTPTKFTPLSRS